MPSYIPEQSPLFDPAAVDTISVGLVTTEESSHRVIIGSEHEALKRPPGLAELSAAKAGQTPEQIAEQKELNRAGVANALAALRLAGRAQNGSSVTPGSNSNAPVMGRKQ